MAQLNVKFLDLGRENEQYQPGLSAAVERVVRSGWYILGPEVAAFEAAWATYCGVPFALGVSNGLDALELALRAWGIGPGDEVIVPSNTYIATWIAVDAVGARVVPVDPNPATYLIETNAVRAAVTRKTKAVIGVHLYGRSLDFEPLRKFCDEAGLKLLEDGAQAQGAIVSGVRTGAQGHAAAFSFYPGKNLGALGDAGAITTYDEETYKALKSLRNYGSQAKYVNEVRGKNCRLDPIQAAVLNLKLPTLDEANTQRRKHAELYSALLENIPDLTLPDMPDNPEENVWHVYPIRCENRDALQAHLAQCGVETLIHYPIPPHCQQAYSDYGFDGDAFPVANTIHQTILSLPISSTHSPTDIRFVAQSIQAFFNET